MNKQTRSHEDVDIVVEKNNIDKLVKLLADLGYLDLKRTDSTEWNFVLGDNKGRLIDVHVVSFDSDGNGIYGSAERGIHYPAYSFKGLGEIDGVPVNCLTAEYQVVSHTGYEIDENDIHDVSELCKRFNIEYPEEYKSFNKQGSS